jgi:hypothetical protein
MAESPNAPLKGPHARRRFTQFLAKLEPLLLDAVATKHDAFPGETLYQTNVRTPMFMLQSLGRVYEHFGLNDKLFAQIRLECKIIEDALGLVDYWSVVLKKGQRWSLPPGVMKLAQEHYHEACGRAWAWVESQDWVACRYHADAELLSDRFRRKLKAVEWLSPQKEAKVLRKWLRGELQSAHEKVLELDLTQIEDGLHKARREIRWASIYFTAMEGAFVLDREAAPPPNWDRYLTRSIIESPFNQWTAPEAGDVPLQVPAPLQYALSYAIEQLGIIKDNAQWTETVEHLLHLTGEKATTRELLGASYLTAAEATTQGRVVVEEVLVKDQVLLKLAEGVR